MHVNAPRADSVLLNRSTCIAAATIALLQLACSNEASAPSNIESCTGYADWQTSAYVLPYAVGAAFRVSQANCSPAGQGHRGSGRYGYDFEMTIGTAVHAARAGRVIHVEVSHSDGEIAPSGFDNYVVVRHADGTHGLYGHLTRAGAFVSPGDSVAQGMRLGRSGNTGNTQRTSLTCIFLYISAIRS